MDAMVQARRFRTSSNEVKTFPPIRRGGPLLWTLATLFVFVPVALLIGANIAHNRAFEQCLNLDPSYRQRGLSNFDLHWTWSPLGFVCRHRDDRGRVIERTRPGFP